MLNTDDTVPAIGDPDRITILQLAEISQPISLPWFAKTVIPGTTFHSRLSNTGDPFGHTTPFKTESLQKSPLVYRIEDGAECTFYSAETKTKLTSRDHMSLSLGVSVGCSFLNASVTGGYDKDVRENRDVSKLLESLNRMIFINYFANERRVIRNPSKLDVDTVVLCSKRHQSLMIQLR